MQGASRRALPLLLAAVLAVPSLPGQGVGGGRRPWAEIAAPAFVSIGPRTDDPARIAVVFTLVTGADGADRATVEMLDSRGRVIESRLIGKSRNDTKTVEFAPSSSGSYRFRVTALRNDDPVPKVSALRALDFRLPLAVPVFRVLNLGGGAVVIRWGPVAEAESYEVSCRSLDTGALRTLAVAAGTEARFAGLAVGSRYGLAVTAVRGDERSVSAGLAKTVRAEADREWTFTWFGQSSKAELNTMRLIDADEPRFQLSSCSALRDGQIDQKGGKFTAFHDGISFYYTVIDPERENFELSATFAIDYINPVPDGQEGFGLLAMDSLGEHGVNARNHYTNSAGVIATKFEATIGGVKKTSKDTVGARFVTGITADVLAQGDTGIVEHASSESHAFSYDSGALVKAGDRYRLTLKKTNTGYHAILNSEYAAPDVPTEYILYGPEKLRQLDKDHVYVGFAVARGCNVTVSDISMRVTDPATDPPAQSEPDELVPLQVKVDSPMTCVSPRYDLVFHANADGRVTIVGENRRLIAQEEPIRANHDLRKTVELEGGINDFLITFSPAPGYRPGAGQVMAAYDRGLLQYVESYRPVSLTHSVIYHFYEAPQLHVSPAGSFLGKGTADDPLDLDTALLFVRPGQPILLSGGTYTPARAVVIPRGHDGTPAARRVLQCAPGERAVFDFRYAPGGLQLWGDYWTIEGIEVCNTVGNVKGIQVGGSHNVLKNVSTYRCGDTGLQISGSSTEPPEKWPRDNLVLNCLSYDNFDPAANNADGFAAKLTCGEGNVFRGCVAYSNIDDGWDLYSKIDTGPIGAVLIDGCLSYRNGSRADGSGNGDGNGFKMGGDGIAVAHRIRHSVAFENGTSGISSNSDPAIIVENCTAFGNREANFAFYGKGAGERRFQARNNISLRGGSADLYRESPELASPDNYFWNGARCLNSLGQPLSNDIFVSVDPAVLPVRRADGTIDMRGFLVLNDRAPPGIGAFIR